MKRILTALLALMLSGMAVADITSLAVQFSPSATQYTKGDVVNVTATANGTNTQYRFILERIDVGVVAVSSSTWSSNNAYMFDTYAVNMPAGKYRLRVLVREAANKAELLMKYEQFTVVAPAVVACDLIDGKTYTNAGAAPLILGSFSLAQALSGPSLTVSTHAFAVSSVSFDAGAVTVAVEDVSVQVCAFICSNVSAPVGDLVGTYTCVDNTVTLSASGTTTGGTSSLYALLGGEMPVSISGSMTIDTGTDSLTAGGKTFE